jgi:hypothetical protein
MEFALAIAIFALGAAAGGLIVAAWMSDRPRRAWIDDGVLHCDGPFTPEDISALRQWRELQSSHEATA